MGKFNTLLNLRLRQKDSQKPKMTALVERAKQGELSSFSGVFQITAPTEKDKKTINDILLNYKPNETTDISEDLENLTKLSTEIKAITNQAVILHGERIKKAQTILKNYQDGAFSAWLMATYGNRQTPYNFLQYYEFYTSMPQGLRKKIDEMPRQAIYTLASREGENAQKEEIVKNYKGEPKREVLSIIRDLFPLDEEDKRQPNPSFQVLGLLKKVEKLMKSNRFKPSDHHKQQIRIMIESLNKISN
jgi:hypothetical protein